MNRINNSIFADLSSLQELYLDENQIGLIEGAAFSGCAKLGVLDLSLNKLTRLNSMPVGLTGVRSLKLSFNELELVDARAFAGMASLVSLDLSNNRIKSLANAVALNDLSSLRIVDIGGNGMEVSMVNLLGLTCPRISFINFF